MDCAMYKLLDDEKHVHPSPKLSKNDYNPTL